MTTSLEGDDKTAYDQAMKFKQEGVKAFSKKVPDKEKALKAMTSALEEIKKVENRTADVVLLEGQICQNTALIHKQNDDLAASLEMSKQAFATDPNNWKALTNIADLSSQLADKDKPLDTNAQLEVHNKAVEDCLKAITLPNADKPSIDKALRPIYLKIASITTDQLEAIKALTGAIDIKEEATPLF